MFDWLLFTAITFFIAKEGIAGYKGWGFDKPTLKPKINPIHNGRMYCAFAFFGSCQWVLSNAISFEERIFLLFIGTLPICIVAFFIGYILVKAKK